MGGKGGSRCTTWSEYDILRNMDARWSRVGSFQKGTCDPAVYYLSCMTLYTKIKDLLLVFLELIWAPFESCGRKPTILKSSILSISVK